MKKIFTILAFALISFAVQAQNCQALFSVTSDSSGLTTFVDLSTTQTGTILSWFWDFGNGSASTLQNVTHQFTPNSTNFVCLTIATDDSCVSTYCDTLIIGSGQIPCIGFGMTYTYGHATFGNPGNIEVSVYGGTPPYNYAWNNGATTSDIIGLAAGTYCVTVTDMAACTLTECVTIWEDSVVTPCQIYITGNVIDESSAGANDGAIDITTHNSLAPYYYYWNNGTTTEDISNLSSGTYTVIVEDADSCTTSATFFVDIQGGQQGPWDTLFTNVVDTCISFIYDTVFVYNYYMIDSFTVSVTWALQGSGQIAYVTVEYAIYQNGYNWFVLSVNCGTKAIETYFDLVYVDNAITNIEALNRINSINLYPNPVKDNLNISLSSIKSENTSLQIFNSTGQLVLQQNIDLINGQNNINLNVNHLNQGIYILRINETSQRFIK